MRLETTATTYRRPSRTLLWRAVFPGPLGLTPTRSTALSIARRRGRASDRRFGRHGLGRWVANLDPMRTDCHRRSSRATAGDSHSCAEMIRQAVPEPRERNASGRSPTWPGSSSKAGEVGQEILQGAAVGFAASLLLAWLSSGSLLIFEIAAIWGSAVGALIGLLLWVGSDDVPEDPILPPSPGQTKTPKKRNRPRARR